VAFAHRPCQKPGCPNQGWPGASSYLALVHERQWTTEEYERWLAQAVIASLLPEAA
jgi:hypothetical protein